MDTIDERILEELTANGRATTSEIGRRVNLSVPAVAERIRKLQDAGVIEGYAARIRRAKSRYRLLAFVSVRLAEPAAITPFCQAMAQHPAVLECHHIAGAFDYLMKVQVADTDGLEEFLSHDLKGQAGVAASNTMVVLSTAKDRPVRY